MNISSDESFGNPADSFILVNALSRKEDVYLQNSGGKLVLLDRASSPVLLQSPTRESSASWEVSFKRGKGKKKARTSVMYYPEVTALGVLSCPPMIEGTLYLVDADVIFQFPDREDFVTPAFWLYLSAEKRKKKSKKVNIRKNKAILAGITRSPWASADDSTLVITEETWIPVEDEESNSSSEKERDTL